MLARYQMVRGKRDPNDPLPDGKRVDTRKHTQHCLRPDGREVLALLADLNAESYAKFKQAYTSLLEQRFQADRAPFDALAAQAREHDVYLGCSCPSAANPEVMRCHTVLALRFMKKKYPKLEVQVPSS